MGGTGNEYDQNTLLKILKELVIHKIYIGLLIL